MSSSDNVSDHIWNKTFISIFIANMLMFLGQQMINTLVAKYANHLGAAPVMVGFVTSGFAYSALLLKLVSAPAIDTFNKKYILTGAILVMAAAFVGYGLSYSIPTLIMFRLLQGAGQAFSATCCLALASNALPPNKLGTGIGYYSLAQVICQSIGPTVGLYLVRLIGYHLTFVTGAGIMIFAAFAAARIRIIHKREKRFSISVKNVIAKEALIPALLMFFLAMANYNINSFLVLYAEEQGVGANIGYFFTIYALTMLFTRPLVGKLSDRFNLVVVLLPAMFFFTLAFFLISISSTIWMFLFSAFVSAFGFGACQPAVQTLCMKCVSSERRGAGSSTNYIGQDLGNLVGPTIAGTIAGYFSYSAMWRFMTIPIVFSMIIVCVFRRRILNAGQ
jgi:MFS family permease